MNKVYTTNRLYYLDWLRFFFISFLIPFHASNTFTTAGITYVKSGENYVWLYAFTQFVRLWGMPLLFFIAGSSSFYSLSFRSSGSFLKERFKRLFIPLVFGTLTLISIQSYFRALSHGFTGNFFMFYPSFFRGVYPKGNFEWGHLWFLAYLLLFTLISLPLFSFMKKDTGKRLITFFGFIFRNRLTVFIPVLFFILSEAFLRPRWPSVLNLYNDWANVVMYMALFFLGYIFGARENAGEVIARNRLITFVLAAAATFTILFVEWNGPISQGYTLLNMLIKGLYGFASYMWVLFFLGFGHRFFNRTGRWHDYVVNFSYPLYIIHFVPLTIVIYYVLHYPISGYLKLAIVIVSAFLISLAFYEILIRRTALFRFLFGMKQKKKQA